MLNKRVHILFDKDLWNNLIKLTKLQKISAGELIRRAVRSELEKNKELLSQRQTPFKEFFKSRSK